MVNKNIASLIVLSTVLASGCAKGTTCKDNDDCLDTDLDVIEEVDEGTGGSGGGSTASSSSSVSSSTTSSTAMATSSSSAATGGGNEPEPVASSCRAILNAKPGAPDGIYSIDPDGAGPQPLIDLFCDMTNGGHTLVANIFDSTEDDAPNDTSYVVSGWQQIRTGTWDNKATTVTRDSSGFGSAAVSLAFVAALKISAGQNNLKICFVSETGVDTSCRTSADGSMSLVSSFTGNPKLTAYANVPLAYTFGRLGGLPGSVDSYDMLQFKNQESCIPRTAGGDFEFGTAPEGICESRVNDSCGGVWHAWGKGMYYAPALQGDAELRGQESGSCNGGMIPNPSVNTYGFRLYVSP